MKKRDFKTYSKKEKYILILCIFSFLVFFILAAVVNTSEKINYLDRLINEKVESIQTTNLTPIMIFITNLGGVTSLIILSILLSAFLIYKKKYQDFMFLASGMITGLIIEISTKDIIQRLRPIDAIMQISSYSYPSGHATMSMIFFIILILSFKDYFKKYKILFSSIILLIPIIIGFTRIYLEVHWTTDVIGGFSLGIFVTSLYVFLKEKD